MCTQTVQWRANGVLLEPQEGFDEIAVKDPSVVFAAGQWHLFYTAIGLNPDVSSTRRSLGYVTAATLDKPLHKRRFDMKQIWPDYEYELMAPQVFFARKLKQWVLIAQRPEPGPTRYVPVFSLSDDIANPNAWSRPEDLLLASQLPQGRTAIDFWVIADEEAYWLFFSDQRDGLWAMRTSIELFPHGFTDPRHVLADRAEDWELHEAAHVYYVPESDDYRMFIEAYEYGGIHANHLERYIAIYRADKLPGPWERFEQSDSGAVIKREQIADTQGCVPGIHQVSHPEWIRLDASDRLMLDVNPAVIVQETVIPSPEQDYLRLGWRLKLIKPVDVT